MAKHRKKIPQKIEAQILFINDRVCCICRDPSKKVQIHHIDGNPNNNNLSNLAVVCINHHDEIHKSGGVTKAISTTLLKKYKHNWELTVRKQRTQQHEPLKSLHGIEKILFKFEIRKTAYEIVALKDSDTDGINQRLEFLHTLYLLEGYTDEILRDLDHIVIMPALNDENKAFLIANKIYEFFYHLVGPEHVKIKKRDINNLELAIKMIGAIGHFSAEFNKSSKVIKAVSMTFENIWDILIWYDLEPQALTILDQLVEISKACQIVFEGEKPLISGIKRLSKLRKKLRKITAKEQPRWKKILMRLSK